MKRLLVLLSALSATLAKPISQRSVLTAGNHATCGVGAPPDYLIEQAKKFKDLAVHKPKNYTKDPIIVDVYMHLILDNESQKPSNNSLAGQLNMLRESYAPYNIMFNYVNTTYYINSHWANLDPFVFLETVTPNLAYGSPADLNLFFPTGMPQYRLAGVCPFPGMTNPDEDDYLEYGISHGAGCIIAIETMPLIRNETNLSSNDITLGETAVHEVGHWFGLAHTFADHGDMFHPICNVDNDLVDDTPISGFPTLGCPVEIDSCPGRGPDPIHNWMSYNDDTCISEFTPGQAQRMHDNWHHYRAAYQKDSSHRQTRR